jgi:hypothetical protein
MEDAELLQRDPNQLVLDVYASGRQNMMRDELVIAKTVDFLVEHATPVSPETVAGEPKAKAANTSDDKPVGATGKADRAAGKTGKKAGKSPAPKRPAKTTSDE